jgi:Flp pilus assembly protein TadD
MKRMPHLLVPPALALTLLWAACAGTQRSSAEGARNVRLAMAEQLARQGDWAAAFAAADALTSEDPSNTPARLVRGTALRHQELLQEAEADLRGVLKAEPRNAAAHSELALLLERAGRQDEALQHHEEARRLAPDEPRYLNALAFALTVRGEAARAVPLLEEALRVEPGNPRYRNNLGFACAASGDFARSAREFARGGTPPQARNNLALAYERAGDLGHAFDLYLEAWRLDPDPRYLNNLEHAARKLGRSLPPEVTPFMAKPAQGGT